MLDPLCRHNVHSNANFTDDSDADVDSDSDSDDDETAALMAELQKIKREKAADEQEKEEKRQQEEEKIRMENILSGNPLLKEKYAGPTSDKSDMKVKRRWDDDVVFKNCSLAAHIASEGTLGSENMARSSRGFQNVVQKDAYLDH